MTRELTDRDDLDVSLPMGSAFLWNRSDPFQPQRTHRSLLDPRLNPSVLPCSHRHRRYRTRRSVDLEATGQLG